MNRADKWKKRPCVVAYFAWCNDARKQLGVFGKWILKKPTTLRVRAYFDTGKQHRCGPHTIKPDGSAETGTQK